MKIKLHTALKHKNRIAGEITRLKAILSRDNSWKSDQRPDADHSEVFSQIQSKTDDLVNLKAAIARANVGIYAKIERMSELKGMIAFLQSLETKCGKHLEHLRAWGSGEALEIEYSAYFTKGEVDKRVAELQRQIDALQDEIDLYNASTDVEV